MPYNRDKDLPKAQRWRAKNLKILAEKASVYRKNNPIIYLLNACKHRAKKLGLPFNLEKSDVFIPTHCPVFGFLLEQGTRGFHELSPSIDRIIPEKGYIKGNIVVISFKANRMKQNATAKELKQLASFYEKLEQEMILEITPAPALVLA